MAKKKDLDVEHSMIDEDRLQKVHLACEAISSIIDMTYPNVMDAMYIVGHTMGETLHKFCTDKQANDIMGNWQRHARKVFEELEMEHAKKEAKNSGPKH
jgi:hypothetical protein